jgi:hypothetical protein
MQYAGFDFAEEVRLTALASIPRALQLSAQKKQR